jgi:toxin HigB-1
VIKTFRCPDTQALFHRQNRPRFQSIEKTARRKLNMLNAARNLKDLSAVPGNQLEKLKRDRQGQHGIRINDQWRVCFVWRDADAYQAEITDYH